jgi:hypothetical protein
LVLPQEAEAEAAKREAELTGLLDEERKKYEVVASEKAALEAELESLSQALFEEVCCVCAKSSYTDIRARLIRWWLPKG